MKRSRFGIPLILLVGAANISVISYYWWLGSGKFMLGALGQQLIALGRISGLLLVLFVLAEVLLIGRTGWLEKSIGFDRMARWHHWIGFGLISLLIAHPTFLSLGYAMRNLTTPYQQFLDLLSWEEVDGALIATVLFILVIAISLIIVLKKMKYEAWYYVHLLVYAAILMAFGHQLSVGRSLQNQTFATYWIALYAFVFINLLYYRFYRPIRNQLRHSFKVEGVEPESKGCISIRMTGRKLDRFRFTAGQYAIFRFLGKGFWHEAHPFSFSSAPDGKSLRITVKDLGDFTSRLKNIEPGTRVIIDGPLGIFTLSKKRKDKILLIAGGVGITPIRALAEDSVNKRIDTVMLYGGRDAATLALKDEIDGLAASEHLRVHYVLSDQDDWGGEKGYIDQEKISRLVPDFAERDIYLCGPAPMMKMVLKAAEGLGLTKAQIHFEKFSL